MQRNKQHITSVSSSLQCGIILALMIGLATPLWALDRVLVCTQDSDEVLLYENDAGLWTFLSIFTDGSVPVDGFALDAPNGIAVSPDGSRVYISESITSFGRVLCYAADGTFIKTVAEDAGSVGNGEFDGQPYHLEFGPDGRLYLSTALDGTTERIYALDVDTNDVSIFVDTTGTGYSLNAPLGFTFVGDDLYVACRGDDADTIDSPGGDEILVFEGPAGSSPGALLQTFYNQANKPKDVFFDSLTGNLFFGATAPNVFLQFTEPGLSDANMPLAGDLEPFEIIRSEGLIHYTANDSDIVRLSADGSSTTTVVTGLSMSRGLAVLETISPTLWDGGGANDNLSTPENWIDDVAPDFGGALVSFSGAARLTPNNDVINAVISHLSFTDQADAFTLGGNGFTLSKRLSNNSTATQTIATAEIDAANASIQANAGNIDVSAPLYLGAASTDAVSIGGPYTTTLTGALGGSGGLTIDGVTTNEDDLEEVGTGGSTLAILTNNGNNYSGPTNINAGVLRIDNPSQLGATSSINVATNEYATRLEIDGGAGMTISKPMNFIDRSSADLGPEDAIVNNLSGDNILSGPLTFTSDGNGNSFLFRMDAGSLTLAGEAEFTGTYGSLRSDGAGTLIVPFAFTGARSIIPRGSSTMRLTNVENT